MPRDFFCPELLEVCDQQACRPDYCQYYGGTDEDADNLRVQAREYYRRFGKSIRRAAAQRVVLALFNEYNDRRFDEDKDGRRFKLPPNPERWRGRMRAAEKARLEKLTDQLLASPKYAQRLKDVIEAILAECHRW
jgi:hypothetical protein